MRTKIKILVLHNIVHCALKAIPHTKRSTILPNAPHIALRENIRYQLFKILGIVMYETFKIMFVKNFIKNLRKQIG